MAAKRATVARLAAEADLDLDEALVLLWDAGFSEIDGPGDAIPERKMSAAKRALGLATTRQLRSITHLAEAAGIEGDEARRRLQQAGLITSRTSDRLPKGALKKSRKVLGLNHAGGFSRLIEAAQELPPAQSEDIVHAAPAFTWCEIGTREPIEFLTAEEIEKVHFALAEDFRRSGDPIKPAGCRDRNLLESAVMRPQTGISPEAKYPTVPMAAAALFHSLALNHAFYNGNKRTALVALLVFLDRNRYVLDVTHRELFKQVLLVAQHHLVKEVLRPHPDHEVLVLASWMFSNMRRVKKGELPLQWRHLRKVLSNYDCEFEIISGRIKIRRAAGRGWFGASKVLKTQVAYYDEGRDADPYTVHKIRKDLHLDEEHGVDSDVFYRGRPVIDDFIAKYRKTLVRLARL